MTDVAGTPVGARRGFIRRVWRWTFASISLGIVLYIVLLSWPGIVESVRTVRELRPLLLLVALALKVTAVGALALIYHSALHAMQERIPYRETLRMSMGMYALSRVIPGGAATAGIFGVARLSSLGVRKAVATTAIFLGGSTMMLVLGLMVAVGSVVLLLTGDLPAGFLWIAWVAVGFFGALLFLVRMIVHSRKTRERVFDFAGRVAGILRLKANTSRWRQSFGRLSEGKVDLFSLAPVGAWALGKWTAEIIVLKVVFSGFGHPVSPSVLLLGFGVGHLVTAIPITPGGLGIAELSMVGVFTSMGTPESTAIVVVLTFRLIDHWLPVFAGTPAYLRGARRAPMEVLGESM